jgi:hypothetical protein
MEIFYEVMKVKINIKLLIITQTICKKTYTSVIHIKIKLIVVNQSTNNTILCNCINGNCF